MLINPFKDKLTAIPGTRILHSTLGLVGETFVDPINPDRTWVIDLVLTPLTSRTLGGIRCRVIDQKGFISFINQRDLELLLEVAKPGKHCPWLGKPYPYINDEESGWVGLFTDEDDLIDDLFEKELHLREQHQWGVLPSYSLTRLVHKHSKRDVERCDTLLWDADPITGMGPDPNLATLNTRWKRVEEEPILWESQADLPVTPARVS